MAYFPQRDPTAVMGRRILAFIIDVVVVVGIFGAILAATRSHSYSNAPPDACAILRARGIDGFCNQQGSHVVTWDDGVVALAVLAAVFVSFLNWVLLEGIVGASVGKLAVGLRVVDREAQLCGVGPAFVRWMLLTVDFVLCFLIGLLTASFSSPHRRVGDLVARTDVVEKQDVAQPVVAAFPAPAPASTFGAGTGWAPPTAPSPGWGASPWGTPPAPPPPVWGTPAPPPPVPPTPAPVAPPPPAAAPPAPEQAGESWWDRISGDDEPKQ